jgi:hypothetical protein
MPDTVARYWPAVGSVLLALGLTSRKPVYVEELGAKRR